MLTLLQTLSLEQDRAVMFNQGPKLCQQCDRVWFGNHGQKSTF